MVAVLLAAVLGIGHAAFSAYWAIGGTWLLDTIGGELERWGRERHPSVVVALWLDAVLKSGVAVAAPGLVVGPGRMTDWAIGGTWLLDTIGGELERWGRERHPSVVVALWLVAVLKTGVAVAAPVLVLGPGRLPGWTTGRAARALSWIAAVVLTAYGGVLT